MYCINLLKLHKIIKLINFIIKYLALVIL